MPAGDFSNSTLAELRLSIEDIFQRERSNRESIADTGTVSTIIENSTANVTPIEGTTTRDNDVAVKWINTSYITGTEDSASDCSPSGTQVGSESKSYTLSVKKQLATPIEVDWFQLYRDNFFDPDQVLAKAMVKGIKEMDNQVNSSVIAKLVSFAGHNFMPDGKLTGFDTGTSNAVLDTYIDAAQWNKAFFAKMTIMNQWNKFENPYLIHNMNFLEESLDWPIDARNDDERDKVIKLTMYPHYWDSVGMSSAGVSDANSYMIDSNALAFGSKHYHPATGMMNATADKVLFTVPSTIPGVRYDVTKTVSCKAGTAGEEYSDVYQVRAVFDLFLAPEIVPGSNDKGVLELIKGTRP